MVVIMTTVTQDVDFDIGRKYNIVYNPRGLILLMST